MKFKRGDILKRKDSGFSPSQTLESYILPGCVKVVIKAADGAYHFLTSGFMKVGRKTVKKPSDVLSASFIELDYEKIGEFKKV